MRRALLILSSFALLACTSYAPDTPPAVGLPGHSVIGQSCGGMMAGPSQSCGTGEYCHREIRDMCGAADAPGTCRAIPEVCTMDYNPVCGCDGKTYPNECAANGNGISAAAMGECR